MLPAVVVTKHSTKKVVTAVMTRALSATATATATKPPPSTFYFDDEDSSSSHHWPGSSSSSTTSSSFPTDTTPTPMNMHLNNNNTPKEQWERLAEITNDPMIMKTSKSILNNINNKNKPIPSSLTEVMVDDRAIVITSTDNPSIIINVNDAWVTLCGYSREEAINQNIKDLLHGPETETLQAANMTKELLYHESLDGCNGSKINDQHTYGNIVLTNYKKNGCKFHNYVTCSSMTIATIGNEYLIGILQEIGTSE